MSVPDVDALPAHVWPGSARRLPDGSIEIGGVSLRRLAEEVGTPVYVLDESDVRRRAADFRVAFGEAFAAIGATCDVYYAGKAFLSTAFARWMHEEGLRLDVCSGGELAVAERAGFPGELIGMHGNNKSVAEIEAAVAYGVGRIVVDSFEEIERITDAARRHGVVVPVMLRVKTGVEAHTHEFIATAHEDQKFGFSLDQGQVAQATQQVLDRPDALRLLGFHSHIGSQIFETDGFAEAARRLVSLQLQVAREHGTTLPELDLGGGFGIAYLAGDTPLPVREMAEGLAEIVRAACADAGTPVPRISVEPGRAIVGPAGVTLYEVGSVKPVQATDQLVRTYVSVDGGMSDNPRPVLYDADYTCALAGRSSGAPPVLARVVGKHCESGDIVVRDVELAGDVQAGDLLAVPATGAYCRSLSSTYNHVPRPPVVAVRDGQVRTLIRRETIADILALEGDS
ncbi:diaminopimelate decarboxylase [Barrientosiimonas humi]|uniref:Diaminopimelate decarboxylase n=1 Tax=Barrientosiimonas humi TaxID=999931 RepID=A0A542X9N1_9MICO|nr:diaminopimelate decarboxylase [Barrientosiimonas humi]TQL32456.1 diaminopimelate decarboxylase [Barrientosiimonas humi]CAG7572447.1 Diaminopimelate decarboxylase [Barrientosiimonas humi]